MPILAREIDLYPDDLLEQIDCDGHAAPRGQWWVFYTKPNFEKQLMRRLRQMEVPFYCPLVARHGVSPGGRDRVSFVPLFPGYVFMFGDSSDRYRAMTTNCVASSLTVADSTELTFDLRQIRQLVESGLTIELEPRLARGARIYVRSGPIAGLEGTMLRRRDVDRVVVPVRTLLHGASVELDGLDFDVLE